MELLWFSIGILGLCVVNFVAGLITWFMVFRKADATWLRQVRMVLALFTILAALSVALVGALRVVVAHDQGTLEAAGKAWLVLAPVGVAGLLSAHLLALHLRIRHLEKQRRN